MTPQLWDFAGIDGLQMAKALFGESIDRLAVFQSLDIQLVGCSCSVLRLCETNFRVVWYENHPAILQLMQQAATGRQVWLQQFDWLGALLLDANNLPLDIIIPKPPYRLPLPGGAAPARIDRVSVLIWRHLIKGQPALEIHTATKDLQFVGAKLAAVAGSQAVEKPHKIVSTCDERV